MTGLATGHFLPSVLYLKVSTEEGLAEDKLFTEYLQTQNPVLSVADTPENNRQNPVFKELTVQQHCLIAFFNDGNVL